MSKKLTDENGVMAKQLANAIAHAIKNGKYVPLASSSYHGGGLAMSSLDIVAHSAMSQLLTIAALDDSLTSAESTDDLLSLFHELRRKYPELAEVIDFAVSGVQALESKRKAVTHEQWIAASMGSGVTSGELFKRLNYLISR